MTAPAWGNGAPRRWIAAVAAGAAALLAAQLVALLLIQLLARVSVDQPLESRELLDWGWRWGGVLAVALASGAGLGGRPPAGPRSSARVAATIAALTVLFSLVAMGLAVAAVRLGLWGQGWGLPSRSTYAAQIAALLTLEWIGLPAAALGAWLLWRGRLGASLPPWRALSRCRPSLDRITRLLTLVIALAVVLNGLPFWARRIGLLDRQAYSRDVAVFCSPPVQPLWLPATCRPHRPSSGLASAPAHRITPAGQITPARRIDWQRFYQFTPPEAGLKALRYGVVVLLLAVSAGLALGQRRSTPLPQALRSRLPLLPLLVSSLVSGLISLPLDGLIATLLSAVWCLWIPQAAISGWLTTTRRLQILADGAAALVLIQVPFVVVEAARGLPLPFGAPAVAWWPTRLSGVINQPNTLGGLLAVSVALCICVSARRWQRWPLGLVAMAISLLARSGTGVVGLALVAVCLLAATPVGRRRPRLAPALALLGLLVLMLGMPRLLGRPQLLESPAGRLRTVRIWLQQPHTPQQWIFGYGVASPRPGRGQNLSAPSPKPGPSLKPEPSLKRGPSVDGMPTLLISQGGLLGLLAFYGFLSWCCWQDPLWRPFWIVLLATSLTLNVSEVFPIGVWMAVGAARVLAPGGSLCSPAGGHGVVGPRTLRSAWSWIRSGRRWGGAAVPPALDRWP